MLAKSGPACILDCQQIWDNMCLTQLVACASSWFVEVLAKILRKASPRNSK